jgi:hypothetical protein
MYSSEPRGKKVTFDERLPRLHLYYDKEDEEDVFKVSGAMLEHKAASVPPYDSMPYYEDGSYFTKVLTDIPHRARESMVSGRNGCPRRIHEDTCLFDVLELYKTDNELYKTDIFNRRGIDQRYFTYVLADIHDTSEITCGAHDVPVEDGKFILGEVIDGLELGVSHLLLAKDPHRTDIIASGELKITIKYPDGGVRRKNQIHVSIVFNVLSGTLVKSVYKHFVKDRRGNELWRITSEESDDVDFGDDDEHIKTPSQALADQQRRPGETFNVLERTLTNEMEKILSVGFHNNEVISEMTARHMKEKAVYLTNVAIYEVGEDVVSLLPTHYPSSDEVKNVERCGMCEYYKYELVDENTESICHA